MKRTDVLKAIAEIKNKELLEQTQGKGKVENVKYLGKMKYIPENQEKEVEKDVYMVSENINGKTVDKIYSQDDECLGAFDENLGYVATVGNADKSDIIKDLTKGKEILNLREELQNENRLEEMAKTLGIDENEIEQMAELDLNQEINIEEKQRTKDDETEISKDKTKEVVNATAKQEMDIDTKVNDLKDLGQKLNLENESDSRFEKIVVVESSYLENSKKETRYAFVAVRRDGTSKVITDELEPDPDFGSDDRKETLQQRASGDVRKNNSDLSRYRLKNNDDITLSVSNGHYGEVEVFYSEGKSHSGYNGDDGNSLVETQLETTNVWRTDKEIRDTQGQYKGIHNADEKLKEANKHFEEHKEDKVNLKDADGKDDTVSHNHISKESYDAIVNKIVEELKTNDEITRVFTDREIRSEGEKLLNKNIQGKEGNISELEKMVKDFKEGVQVEKLEGNIEEEVEKLKEDMEEEASHIPTRDTH